MPVNVITVLGARPQFVKASALSRAFAAAGVSERLLHTGQHYDEEMSGVFFSELGIPEPRWNLACGGLSQGAMTAAMLQGIERILIDESPEMVIVYGDTNSTLAGALAAAKLHIPVAHVEAGLRSFNRRMPEELNRICTDNLSGLLFCSSERGRAQLASEGITGGVHVTGDIMADVFFTALAKVRSGDRPPLKVTIPSSPWALMTLHREANTSDPQNLRSIFAALDGSGIPVIFPVHPRTLHLMAGASLQPPPNVQCIEPAGYGELVALLDGCTVVLTDSGGLQKEAYWAEKPCITLRDETEWTELLETGWNVLTGASQQKITAALHSPPRGFSHPPLYGDGHAADRMVEIIVSFLQRNPTAG
ncbi:MAG TPA: UDP-N-acetylglucosamine 2-epimerase (non-hydrolyzing) [Verrucomicrobiales bacterium]|nr:UDP-N-acetylglucosamine 2-epimerase (non-hydrolyzing) [Verrucomicrobiales bacterium]